jgi:hypothetical protein
MSETVKSKAAAPTEPAVPSPPAAAAQQAETPAPARIEVNDKDIAANCYANFCRVTGTPEELIVDFGLNSQPFGVPTEAVVIQQRIVMNYYTAKRLLHALHLSVQRNEQAFGVLETDVNKRIVGRPQA